MIERLTSAHDLKSLFYVYAHKKKTTGEIFYIGKGRGERYRSKSGRSNHWRNIVKKHGCEAEILGVFESEHDAYSFEVYAIKSYRDKGKKLCNIYPGGDGRLAGWKHSDEIKEKFRQAKLGKPQSKEHAEKSRSARKGKRNSPEHIERTASFKRKPVINSDGEIFPSACAAATEISKRQKIYASQGNISMCARGLRNNAYGTTWSYNTDTVPAFIPTKHQTKKIQCSNGIIFDSVREAQKWVKEWRGSASHQPISDAARSGKKSYGYYWEYRNEIS